MKIIDKILKVFKKKTKTSYVQDASDVAEQIRIQKAYDNAQKMAWEKANELAKKIDACNLGMTKTAFNGTYEEYKNKEYQRTFNALSGMCGNGAQQMGAVRYGAQAGLGGAAIGQNIWG